MIFRLTILAVATVSSIVWQLPTACAQDLPALPQPAPGLESPRIVAAKFLAADRARLTVRGQLRGRERTFSLKLSEAGIARLRQRASLYVYVGKARQEVPANVQVMAPDRPFVGAQVTVHSAKPSGRFELEFESPDVGVAMSYRMVVERFETLASIAPCLTFRNDSGIEWASVAIASGHGIPANFTSDGDAGIRVGRMAAKAAEKQLVGASKTPAEAISNTAVVVGAELKKDKTAAAAHIVTIKDWPAEFKNYSGDVSVRMTNADHDEVEMSVAKSDYEKFTTGKLRLDFGKLQNPV